MRKTESKSGHRIRVKVCGMTDSNVVSEVVRLGVDAIGVILHADSPRQINLDQAKRIRDEVPAFVSLVGVFVDCPASKVEMVSQDIGLDLVQLHGAETNNFGLSLLTPYIKAIRARNRDHVNTEIAQYPDARALLLDPYVEGMHGGTGKRLDDSLWPDVDNNMILAGGLSAANVADAVKQLKPFAVDLNSGVEIRPGVKDIGLIEQALIALGR